MKKYLDKRMKGKINYEIYTLSWDLKAAANLKGSQTSHLTKVLHRIKNKEQLIKWHTKRIRKYANSKKVNLTPEQDQFIEEILKLENQDGNLNYNNYDFTTTAWLQMDDEIFKVPFLFKLWYGLLNGVVWCIIFSIIILFLIIRNYII